MINKKQALASLAIIGSTVAAIWLSPAEYATPIAFGSAGAFAAVLVAFDDRRKRRAAA